MLRNKAVTFSPRCLLKRLTIAGGALLLAAGPLAASFWDSRDWTGWSANQCLEILNEVGAGSPWAQTDAGSNQANGWAYQWFLTIQFRSALPVRLALARLDRINMKYDRMNPRQQEEFNRQHQVDLSGNSADPVALHVIYGSGETGRRATATNVPSASPARMILADGRQVSSSMPESIRENPGHSSVEYDLYFPRMIDGRPLLKPGDRKFYVQFEGRIEFDASKMMFHGKLEY
jgi:hypothetical protein